MQLNDVIFNGPKPIDGYGAGFFRIGGKVLSGPVTLIDGQPALWQGLADITLFLSSSAKIDVLFVGMGKDIANLPEEVRAQLEQAGIGVEVMATPGACRTYNVLLAEGRRVAAALLPV